MLVTVYIRKEFLEGSFLEGVAIDESYNVDESNAPPVGYEYTVHRPVGGSPYTATVTGITPIMH